MNESVHNRILKDANGDIGEHLHNQIHLTNCIHLKHRMHKQSPILADGSLMRSLIVLQQSRSLRDPTASLPPVLDLLPKKGNEDSTIREGRKSVGIGRSREGRRLSGSSPFANAAVTNVVPGDVNIGGHGLRAVSSSSNSTGIRDSRRIKGEKHSQTSRRFDLLGDHEEPFQDQDVNVLVQDVVSGNSESKSRSKQRENHSKDFHIKTLSQQLREAAMDSDVASSNTCHHGRHPRLVKSTKGTGSAVRGYDGLTRTKGHKFRGTRRTRAASASRDTWGQSELPITSNSSAQCSAWPRFEEEEEYRDPNIAHAPMNGCGIPWKWSRIHDRGKTFLDMAGRSFSCGQSDSRLKKGGTASHHRDNTDVPVAYNHSSSSTESDAEAWPLLVKASKSHESTDKTGWVQDYSGELGIYADHLLKSHVVSDFVSEARSDDRHKYHKNHNGRHQNLTEKYMPRTFKDLVGQNLVVQALSNAVTKRKVGLLYVFYGPHGTGKTSCARIFARALNCQSLEHPKPCSFCNSCIAHDMSKSQTIREVGPVSNFDHESIIDLLDNVITSDLSSRHKVFVFDDCDTLSPDCWSSISKVVDRAPRHVVIVFVCLSLNVLPHIIMSRCQKFFFPRLKDADIISTLQWIASKEDIDIEKDALKLIASQSDGSLRDAEMTLEQLSLLGQKIFITVVQELVGLVSDEKLVDLLDFALSADTENTVKNLRVIMETGVEPLALMSQLATVITDILAGSYDFTKERHRRKFFQRQPLRKESMEKLRQALKTLSEAEKQLRMSNDKLTWLTAALLQLAPDRQYLHPCSSTETNFKQGTLALNNTAGQDIAKNGDIGLENLDAGISGDIHSNGATNSMCMDGERNSGAGMAQQWISPVSSDGVRRSGWQITAKGQSRYEEIWLAVLDKIQINKIREFLYQEGRLISVSFGAAPTVQLMLSSLLTKSKAEKFNMHILQAFESVLGSPLTIEIRCGPNKERSVGLPVPPMSPASKSGPSQMGVDPETKFETRLPGPGECLDLGRSEIVEISATPRENKGNGHVDGNTESTRKGLPRTKVSESAVSHRKNTAGFISEISQSKTLVRSKVSLAHVLQQAEGCTQQMGWSRSKAISIAEKLEQENLRLEPRSRTLLCWKVSEVTRRKFSRSKKRTRNPDALLKLVSCGKCLSSNSPK